jgi:hypothetical protein
MRFRCEVERRLRTPAAYFDVVIRTVAIRDAGVGKIRDVGEKLGEALFDFRRQSRRLLDALVERRDLRT